MNSRLLVDFERMPRERITTQRCQRQYRFSKDKTAVGRLLQSFISCPIVHDSITRKARVVKMWITNDLYDQNVDLPAAVQSPTSQIDAI